MTEIETAVAAACVTRITPAGGRSAPPGAILGARLTRAAMAAEIGRLLEATEQLGVLARRPTIVD